MLTWASAPRSLFVRFHFFVQLALAWCPLWVVLCGIKNALVGQIRAMSNFKIIPLTNGEPRDVELDFITPLMGVKNPQSSEKALSADSQRHHV